MKEVASGVKSFDKLLLRGGINGGIIIFVGGAAEILEVAYVGLGGVGLGVESVFTAMDGIRSRDKGGGGGAVLPSIR